MKYDHMAQHDVFSDTPHSAALTHLGVGQGE